MEKIKKFVDSFHSLSNSSSEEFNRLFTKIKFNKNDVLYRTGEKSGRFFILTKGIARSVVLDSNGKEKTRTIFKAPIVFTSLISSLNSKPSLAEFNCLTDVTMYEGNFLEFINLTQKASRYFNFI